MKKAKDVVKEAYIELLKELNEDLEPNQDDITLGDVTTQLATAKGELATILDRAAREGVIKREGGRVQILKKDQYLQQVGDLPSRIKALQQKLEPESHPQEQENDF